MDPAGADPPGPEGPAVIPGGPEPPEPVAFMPPAPVLAASPLPGGAALWVPNRKFVVGFISEFVIGAQVALLELLG